MSEEMGSTAVPDTADSNMADPDIELISGVKEGSVERVLAAIEKGGCLNLSVSGSCPLLEAVLLPCPRTSLGLVQLLLLYGADPARGANNRFPLHEAVRLNRTELVNTLLGYNCPTDTKNFQGKTAVDYVSSDEVGKLLAGHTAGTEVKFHKYVFEDDTEEEELVLDKENFPPASATSHTTDFLREVEKIFLGDIAGAAEGTRENKEKPLGRIDEEMGEIAEELEKIGFRTPNIYNSQARRRVDSTNLRRLGEESAGEKVAAYLHSVERSGLGQEQKTDVSQSNSSTVGECFRTPVRSYMRPTKASNARRRNILMEEQGGSARGNTPGANRTKSLGCPSVEKSIENQVEVPSTTWLNLGDRTSQQQDSLCSPHPIFSSTLLSTSHRHQPRGNARTPKLSSSAAASLRRAKSAGPPPPIEPSDRMAREEEVVILGKSTCSGSGTLRSQGSQAASGGVEKSSVISIADTSSVSVSQEYLLTDRLTGEQLLEKRLPSILGMALQDEALLNQLQEEAEEAGEASTLLSIGSLQHYNSIDINRELSVYGEAPAGPITSDTKRAYLLRLKKLRMGLVVPSTTLYARYPSAMADSIRNVSCLTKNWEELWKLEESMSVKFSCVDPQLAAGVNFLTRETVCKSSFNYILLDPRKTQNLPLKVFARDDQDLWRTFVDAVFYIGKGTRSRPFQHLYDACRKRSAKQKAAAANAEKIGRILEIWRENLGVVSLQVFNNAIAVEGLTREAAMIDAIGLGNLTNVRPGDYYGPAAGWSADDKRRLGTFLLFRAFKIFLQEGERQIRPVDLRPQKSSTVEE